MAKALEPAVLGAPRRLQERGELLADLPEALGPAERVRALAPSSPYLDRGVCCDDAVVDRDGQHATDQADRVLAEALRSPASQEVLDDAAIQRADLHVSELGQDVAGGTISSFGANGEPGMGPRYSLIVCRSISAATCHCLMPSLRKSATASVSAVRA